MHGVIFRLIKRASSIYVICVSIFVACPTNIKIDKTVQQVDPSVFARGIL